ncbi:unnamed protein product [Arabidopsis lyrata]|uniref:WRKY domain-containing protein n=1 Tax=Arabidopsis lyrata subsp. lyrata TaxID=81972 RepID=D7MY15_ARALL|nr:hypothetical protein ARALYDRAFT_920928 [Arabidopsis lyrata subsp. lyrata]CAH8258768.1 unnamed protein product [Arabidopsis lyrata]
MSSSPFRDNFSWRKYGQKRSKLLPIKETMVDDTSHIMNQECDDNELLMEDDQFWENEFPPFSPGHIMFLGDIDAFDSKPCQLIEWELDLV